MRIKLELVDDWNKLLSNCGISTLCDNDHDYELSIYFDGKTKIQELLKEKSELIEYIDSQISFLNTSYADYIDSYEKKIEIEKYQELKRNIYKIENSVDTISLDFDTLDYSKYINSDPFINSKKIMIDRSIDITNYNLIKGLSENCYKYSDSIYVKMKNNEQPVTINKCLDTMEYIITSAETIKKYNMSPIEIAMYLYNIVRNRVYKEVEKGEDYLDSRDLSSVVNGDKIVCVGYASIYDELLKYFGFKCNTVYLENTKNFKQGHARNRVYIKDEKYGIDGVYYFDTTYDSRNENDINEYLHSFLYFAKTRMEFDKLEHYRYIDLNMPYYSPKVADDINKLFDLDYREVIYSPVFKSINNMSLFVTDETLLNVQLFIPELAEVFLEDKDELINKAQAIVDKFNKPISAETYIRILNNVRQIEHNENPTLYPYSEEDLRKTYIKSRWEFKKEYLGPRQRIASAIFGDSIVISDKAKREDAFIEFMKEAEIPHQIEKSKQKVKK